MRPEITVILRINAKHQRDNMEAVYEGLKSIGIPAVFQAANVPVKTKKIAIWGWRLGNEFRSQNKDILVVEHSYIGDRKFYSSLGWNGLNGNALMPTYPDDSGERFKAIGGVLKPWRENPDAPVLILGQLKGDSSLQGIDAEKEYNGWIRTLKSRGERVLFRHHPESIKHNRLWDISGAEISTGSLQEALDGAKYAVVFNSNSAVDAILNGTPCVAMDKGTMAYDVCGKGLGDIQFPDREKWAHNLAYCQWTLEEISSGKPLKPLFEMEL